MHTKDSLRPERRLFPSLLLLVSLVLAGCGGVDTVDEATESSPSPDEQFPAEVLSGPVHGGTEITIQDEPAKIVSLSPTATEMLWEIGAGDQVVAVDDQSDYPKDVPTTKLSGYEPNVEAVLEYEPDLVVAADDTGDLVANLEKARVPTLLLPAAEDLEETYSQMERLGAATGHADEAEQDVTDMREGIDQALADAPDADGLTYFHELTPGPLHRRGQHVHRRGLRALRAGEHRGPVQGEGRLPQALPGVRRPGRPGPGVPGRQPVLRRLGGGRRGAAGLGAGRGRG